MAAILQLRRGAISDFSSYGTNVSEPYFDTGRDTIHIGTTDGSGSNADFITLVKLSQANRDFTKNEANTGSLWIVGDITGSDFGSGLHATSSMYLSGNITASHGWFKNNVRIDGHLIMGDNQPDDVVTVRSDFSGNLIPDNDEFGQTSSDATDGLYDLGQDTKRWRNIYLQKDGSGAGFLSGSHIDLTGNIKVDGEGRFGTLRVDDLTDNRILLAGVGGEVEDSPNLTYDGQDFRLTNSDYYQSGSGASWQFVGAGGEVTGSWTISELAVDNGIVFTNAEGTLDNQDTFTWDGGFVNIVGGITASQDLTVNRAAYLASAKVEDLTEDRIVIAGNRGEIEDDQYFRFTGNDFIVGDLERFRVQVASGNTFISGAVQMFSTLNVDGQSTLASLNVEDLTDNRVVIVGAGGEIEDDGNFTFNGTELNIGTGNFTVQQGSGNVHTVGNVDIDLDLNIDGGDLTTNQSTFNLLNSNATTVNAFGASTTINVGTGGQGGGLTTIGHDLTVVGDLTIQGETTQLNTTTLNVEDKNILIASGALNASAANGAGITIDGANATLTYESTNNWFTFDRDTQVQGDLYVTNEISSSTVNGIGNVELYSASVDSRLDYLEGPFSTSVDSRLNEIEGPMSTSLDLRILESFSTASDHETRIDEIEGPFSTSVDSRLDLLESTGSDHETRLDELETTFSSSVDLRIDELETFSASLDSIYVNESDYTTDSSSFDSRINAISFDTASLLTTASIETSTSGSVMEFTKGNDDTFQLEIPGVSPTIAANSYLVPVILTGSAGNSTYLDSSSFQKCSIIQLKYEGENGIHNVYLPKASAPENTYRAIRIISNGTVTANNEFYLYASGSDKLDGNSGSLSEFQFDRPYEGIMVWSDGTEWFRVQSKA